MNPLKKHIYIYSPSGAVRDKAAFKRGVARLKTLGHEVEIDPAALASHQRFAGDDETRLASIHRAAASGADVALISRGGYGITRLLGRINYKAVAKSIQRGTQFVGISDFTALSLAVMAKTDQITWAGPALCEGFGVDDKADEADAHGHSKPKGASQASPTTSPTGPDDIMEACFDDMITGQGEGTGWRVGASSAMHVKKAKLWGGNLAVLSSLVGTPYLPQVKGGVLFLEDVAEHPYRIERMLTQLLHAGILSQQKAIVLGQFTEYKLVPHDKGFKLQSVVDWLRTQVKIPVLTKLPFGHVPTKVLLPVGATVDLIVEEGDALILWGELGERS